METVTTGIEYFIKYEDSVGILASFPGFDPINPILDVFFPQTCLVPALSFNGFWGHLDELRVIGQNLISLPGKKHTVTSKAIPS